MKAPSSTSAFVMFNINKIIYILHWDKFKNEYIFIFYVEEYVFLKISRVQNSRVNRNETCIIAYFGGNCINLEIIRFALI